MSGKRFSATAALICLLAAPATMAVRADAPRRGLAICVSAHAPESVQSAARTILDAVASNPLLQVMAEGRTPGGVDDTASVLAAPIAARAYSYLVVVGLVTDPLVQAVWQHQARSIDNGAGLYVFGYGNLVGDIGYIESDRNPFLHSSGIKQAPFETEEVTIAGTTAKGVALAADAFLRHGLVNGVVAGQGWKRDGTTLLDRDPLPVGFAPPSWIPATSAGASEIAITQAGEDEYRGVLADTGVEPAAIWRIKYFSPGAWDGVGDKDALANFADGLNRLAYGNTLWCAQFDSVAAARAAAPKIAASAGLAATSAGWNGVQPPYAGKVSAGVLSLWTSGSWVLMSTLTKSVSDALRSSTSPAIAAAP